MSLPFRTDRDFSRIYGKHDAAFLRARQTHLEADVDGPRTLIFVEHPWGRRTAMALLLHDEKDTLVTCQQTCRNWRHRWFESIMRVLEHNVRVDCHILNDVHVLAYKLASRDKISQYGDAEDEIMKFEHRPKLLEMGMGEYLHKARSVNDLLKAFYNVIEHHRTLLKERTVLHCDSGVRTYSSLYELERRNASGSVRVPITDALSAGLRTLYDSKVVGIVVDPERVPLLSDSCDGTLKDVSPGKLETPVYIARSACLKDILTKGYTLRGERMPKLEGEELRLYIEVYGAERYNTYNDKTDQTIHGGEPDPDLCPEFTHRAEHDVESIFWSMFTTFLRVRPLSSTSETTVSEAVTEVRGLLRKHVIVENPRESQDPRNMIFDNRIGFWNGLFLPEMHDVARLMWQVSKHIAPEYAYWTGNLHQDHLHEALQRLILQYLVNHRDKAIPLDSNLLRPTRAKKGLGGTGSQRRTHCRVWEDSAFESSQL